MSFNFPASKHFSSFRNLFGPSVARPTTGYATPGFGYRYNPLPTRPDTGLARLLLSEGGTPASIMSRVSMNTPAGARFAGVTPAQLTQALNAQMRWTPATRALNLGQKVFSAARIAGARVLPALASAAANPYVWAAVAAVAIVAGIAYFVYKKVNGSAKEPPPPPENKPAEMVPEVPVLELPEPMAGYPRSLEEIRRYASLLDPGDVWIHPRLRKLIH